MTSSMMFGSGPDESGKQRAGRVATRLAAMTRKVTFPLTMTESQDKQLLCLLSEATDQLKSYLGGSVLPLPFLLLYY